MKTAPIPENDHERVSALRALNVLDSDPEERFERLTRLAKRLFGVPIALVSLVDENRQWFKSRQGLDACETGRDISFCGHAIHGDEMFVVPDALKDSRFSDNPLVTSDPHIRFYAGIPLSAPCGSKIGTMCIIDRDVRELDSEDEALLRDLARMAEQELAAVQLASMDELTLISNRRGFVALGQHALNNCRRFGRPATLLFFDLDQFKPINDQFGHAEGDRALVGFAKILKDAFRDSDVIGRIGGDEFAVLLTGTNEAECETLLDRFDELLDSHNQRESRGYEITYSVGTAGFDPEQHAKVEQLMEDADEKMYQHKSSRRLTRRV